MKKQICVTCLLLILSLIGFAQADIVTVQLAELVGPVGRYPDMITVDVDLGVTFSGIQSVKIQLSGTITPGLGCGDGVLKPVLPYYDVPGVIEVFMDHPAVGDCITTIGPFGGSFSVEQALECTYDVDWAILLDGRQKLFAHITSPLIVLGGSTLDFPAADISYAALIVQGDVVPEPSSILLLSLASVMLRKKHRR